MTASVSLDIFLARLFSLRMKLSVIFHLPEYKAISNSMQHLSRINSNKHVKEKIQTFTIV